MKLVELVNYFRNDGFFEDFCHNKSLDLTAEVIEIYMEKPFCIDKNLAFFEIEKTEGKVEFSSDGVTYYNLFDFYYFLDVIKESKETRGKSMSDREIAEILLAYAINDA